MSGSEQTDLSGIERLYETSLDEHGADSPGVGWRDTDSHVLRFAKLVTVLEGAGSELTINDLGCGYGAFYRVFQFDR